MASYPSLGEIIITGGSPNSMPAIVFKYLPIFGIQFCLLISGLVVLRAGCVNGISREDQASAVRDRDSRYHRANQFGQLLWVSQLFRRRDHRGGIPGTMSNFVLLGSGGAAAARQRYSKVATTEVLHSSWSRSPVYLSPMFNCYPSLPPMLYLNGSSGGMMMIQSGFERVPDELRAYLKCDI